MKSSDYPFELIPSTKKKKFYSSKDNNDINNNTNNNYSNTDSNSDTTNLYSSKAEAIAAFKRL